MNTVWIRGKHTVTSTQVSDEDLAEQLLSGEINEQCECGDYLSESFSREFGSRCPKCRPIEGEEAAE